MKHDTATEYEQEQAALYALGALGQHEARAFESHLREHCNACGTEVSEFDEVIAILDQNTQEVTPPAYVRDLLASRIEREAAGSAKIIPFPEQAGFVEHKQMPSKRSGGRLLVPWAIAASLAALAVVSLLAWRVASDQSRRLQEQLARSESERQQLNARLERQDERGREFAQISDALASPGARVITLAGQETVPNSSARIYWDVQNRKWVVTADLPPPPAGKVYQLWFINKADAKLSAGLIRPDNSGHGFAVVDVPGDAADLAAAAITLEPEGGSAQPTMPIYAVGKAA